MWRRIKSHFESKLKREGEEQHTELKQCQIKIDKNEEVDLPDFEVEDLEAEVMNQSFAHSESVMSIQAVC